MNSSIRKISQHSRTVYEPADPSLVTEMLMTILATFGKWIHVQQIKKRDRDDVLCSGDGRPWRRSSLWLLVKITIQTTLIHSVGYETGTSAYKNFVTYLLVGLLRRLHRGSDEQQHILRAKIARRLFKLEGTVYPFVVESASEALNSSREAHERNWNSAIECDAQRSTSVTTSSIAKDTSMRLDKCTKFVKLIMKSNAQKHCPKVPFAPSHQHLVNFLGNGLPQLPLDGLRDEEMVYALTNVETWVMGDLFDWTTSALPDPRTDMYLALRKLARQYRDLASPVYQGNAEQSSIMILTVAAIWWALDRLACSQIILLQKYPPEIPESLFDPLILPRREHMELLRAIESHIVTRNTSSEYRVSVFDDPFKSAVHFSVLHYDSDDTQKTLRNSILAKARNLRERKRLEWREKSAEYQRLLAQVERSDCIYLDDGDFVFPSARYHNSHCEYCRLKKMAEAITIQPHEWPLPEDLPCSKAVVFELKCPPLFGAWRDVTWMIVGDLGVESQMEKGMPRLHLHEYEGLAKFYKSGESDLILSSVTAPLSKARAKIFRFPVEEEDVFCQNGLKYFFFDRFREVSVRQVRSRTPSPNFTFYCRVELPEGPYKPLQPSIESTSHSQNEVIATQAVCPNTMSLHEYIAYGSLRADGESTQWLNITRELYGAALSLNSSEVCKLITYAIWQAGSSGDCLFRKSHRLIASEFFCREILAGVRALIEPTCSNWKNDNILQLSVTIILRILGLNLDAPIAKECLNLLSRCRKAAREWMMTLHEDMRQSDDGHKLLQLRDRLLKAVLLCRMTYDREWDMMEKDLNDAAELQTWTVSSIILRQSLLPNEIALDREVQMLKIRDCKLAWRVWSLMTTSTTGGMISTVLDASLAEFRIASVACPTQWSPCDPPNSRWFEKQVNTVSGGESKRISFNALEGHLLVDGQPLGRLPTAYVQSKAYTKLFGNRVVPVLLSDVDDMHFVSAQSINGFLIYFGLLKDYHTIRLSKDGVEMEVLPQDLFVEEFPSIFVNEYIHLLNRSTKDIEFRALTDPWRETNESWSLTFDRLKKATFSQQEKYLLGFSTPSFSSVLSVLGQLEDKQYIHAMTSPTFRLQIDLPRLGLRFRLNSSGQLENRELRMIVDENQSLETLIGLRSCLVLRFPSSTVKEFAKTIDRVVIVPVGQIKLSRNDSHVLVEIKSESRAVSYYRYYVDDIVGRLRSDGSAKSELYLVYLHAITASILKDPLTSRTGTVEALELLRRQLNSVIAPLTDAELVLLQLIRALTPERSHCSHSNGKMYHVTWTQHLSAMTHHDDFAVLVEKIIGKSERFRFFYPTIAADKDEEAQPYGDAFLATRARIRNSVFRPQIYRKSLTNPDEDALYVGRRAEDSASRTRHVYEIASYIADWGERKPHTRTLIQDVFELGVLSGFERTLSLTSSIPDLLQLPLGEQWGSLWNLCCQSSYEKDAFHLRFLFGIIAYGSDFENLDCLKTLSAFAMIGRIRDIPDAPAHTSYDVGAGAQACVSVLKAMLKEGSGRFKYTRPNQPKEQKRKERARYEEELNKAAEEYQSKWPCEEPQMISSSGYHWVNIEKVHSDISTIFRKWSKNRALAQYLTKVQAIFDDLRDDQASSTNWRGAWPRPTEIERVFRRCNLPSLADLMDPLAPTVIPQVSEFRQSLDSRPYKRNHPLRAILNDLRLQSPTGNTPTFRQAYKNRLLHSLNFLERSLPPQDHEIPMEDLSFHILSNYEACSDLHRECMRCFSEYFSPNPANITYLLLRVADLWPEPSVCDLLGFLSSRKLKILRPDWKSAFVALGISVTAVQRSCRLISALVANDRTTLVAELDNYSSINLVSYPQWLLVEIEGNFRTRESQARVAKEMISPTSKRNNLLQLSMGEGKTSVITPLVLASLANGQDLCRLLVLKPLIRQTHTLLKQRICGLLNQPLYFMPFSRQTPMDSGLVTKTMILFKECIANHGILLVQPEHLLSFNLMVRERRIYGPLDVAAPLQAIDRWLSAKSRDVLDESDEILECRFQQIYMLGLQKQLDGAPHRWTVVQTVLDLVNVHTTELYSTRPNEIQVSRKSQAAFPSIEMFSSGIEQLLLHSIVESVGQGRIPTISFQNCPPERKFAVLNFISNFDVIPAHCDEVSCFTAKKPTLMKKLLLLRGLIAHGLLIHAIKDKRWSVNYGLHPTKCMSAVPYRAHKVPAISAEFAQPEVFLLLTCLAYYNEGLSPAKMKQSFEVLARRNDPAHDFELWIRHCSSLPRSLRDYRSCNLDDERLFEAYIFPALRYSKALVDFYLAHIVFPQEAKEFNEKLSTSAWDIPLTSGTPHLSTGFSGTSDNSFLLPSSINQSNLRELELTSAKILDLVLRQENLRYNSLPVHDRNDVAVGKMIEFITKADPSVRVLIDVGAQAVGIENEEVIRTWLRYVDNVEAGIYFDTDDNLMVMARSNKKELLAVSSFNMRIDQCVVFLDEVHTRVSEFIVNIC